MSEKIVTVEDVEREAMALVGVPFVHQGLRPEAGGLDCRGVLEFLAFRLFDRPLPEVHNYQRKPDHAALREGLEAECDEIAVAEAGRGDVVLIKLPRHTEARHVGVLVKGTYEIMLVHAWETDSPGKVICEPYRGWLPRRVVAAFRLRGVSR